MLKTKIRKFPLYLATWFDRHASIGCEYVNPGSYSTKNGLENTNNAIKLYYTGFNLSLQGKLFLS